MTKHPLTDEICLEITNYPYMTDARKDDMRTAADWQLEQVAQFLRNYEYLEAIAQHINVEEIIDDLKKAMHPTKALEGTGREGALNALDRLYEENDEGLRRLAQEDS